MSSEGSVSSDAGSRIRQFGLYRSIDARTEEFLRLSRKRQIRQGCACAAVSTAITVTVVVVVLFVYEFSLNSNVNVETSLRANWFSLTNDTTDDGFQTKYTKSSFDKTTLTLLPILLKALKKNVFLEKLIEEQASTSPTYESRETTENSFDKNVFSRNWFPMPSKLYAIAYKTSPIAYFKSPSKNVEYFTKIRKIRDYQRIVQYVDKMINEKVYIGSTKPMMTEIYSEKPSVKPVPRMKPKRKHKNKAISPKSQVKKISTANSKAINTKEKSCKCPIKFSELLHKILSGIQTLLFIESENKQKISTDCDHKIASQNFAPAVTELPEIESNKIRDLTSPIKVENYVNSNQQQNDINFIKNKIATIHDILYKNSLKLYENNIDHKTEILKPTPMVNNYIDSTDDIEITQPPTKPMKSDNLLDNAFGQNAINILQNSKPKFNENINIYSQEFHNNDDDEKSATSTTTASTTMTSSHFLENNQLELIKNNLYKQLENLRQETFDSTIAKSHESIPELSEINKEKITRTKDILLTNINKAIYQVIKKDKNIQVITKPTVFTTSTLKTNHPMIETSTLIEQLHKKTDSNKLKNATTIVEEETETLNNLTQEDVFKQTDNISIEHPIETNSSVTERKHAMWEELKNENIPAWKSMLPRNRPTYLEIQRNGWKRDEQQDYDLNFINNYDLPDNIINT